MLKKILGVVVALVAVLLVAIAMQPSEFSVERSETYDAPPAEVFAQINDFHLWQAWSPWAKMDPNAKNTYEGPSSGTGAIFRWAGDANVGEGNMTITESKPNELIVIRLEFIKPMAGVNTTEFTLTPAADKTVLKWKMYGPQNFVGKAFHLFMDMDKMVGTSFEQGLASIKGIVEGTGK